MIRIQNIYYMLSYAFQVLNEQGYKQVATEEFDNVAELCAAILIKGVSLQIKRGLGKEYVLQTESLSALRGKIDISASVKEQSMLKKQLVCNYDEFSVNSYMNRIIRTTMDTLVRSSISKDRKKQLRKLLIYFSEVEPLNRESINWKLQFNKNNQTYQSDKVISQTLYLDKVKERIAWYCDTTNTIDYELNPDFDSDSFLFAFEDTDMNDHQKEIVAQLWGIYTGKPMSKKEVAENMGVTYNRIRQVEICCLRHILRNRNRNTLIKEK